VVSILEVRGNNMFDLSLFSEEAQNQIKFGYCSIRGMLQEFWSKQSKNFTVISKCGPIFAKYQTTWLPNFFQVKIALMLHERYNIAKEDIVFIKFFDCDDPEYTYGVGFEMYDEITGATLLVVYAFNIFDNEISLEKIEYTYKKWYKFWSK